MQLRITDAYRTRVRKVHNNGDNGLAKQVPQKPAGGGWEINMQQIVALSHKGRLSIACASCEKSYIQQVPDPHTVRWSQTRVHSARSDSVHLCDSGMCDNWLLFMKWMSLQRGNRFFVCVWNARLTSNTRLSRLCTYRRWTPRAELSREGSQAETLLFARGKNSDAITLL